MILRDMRLTLASGFGLRVCMMDGLNMNIDVNVVLVFPPSPFFSIVFHPSILSFYVLRLKFGLLCLGIRTSMFTHTCTHWFKRSLVEGGSGHTGAR
ncbi:hypothetical protein F5B22DRAFT_594234 [Xylaria bambusicola]|uniref:uncharacterized protein n=1 Tax=Xylaria bambusicola TaxID=326684 RepID=UPI002007AA55|nr:uncharacterized protein F5B22DRAFT_594234 [Xylaria bambusicola]KAI0521830.1 hypothetical protein F5B22DRAFT_594234 [Xylaria bambusicola]